jgi:hypothetical protein
MAAGVTTVRSRTSAGVAGSLLESLAGAGLSALIAGGAGAGVAVLAVQSAGAFETD